jgi:hypothetical protein
VFDPGKPFQPSLLFVGKTRRISYSGSPVKHFTRVSSCLTHKPWKGLQGMKTL